MIRLTSAKHRTVAKTKAGNLILFFSKDHGEWLHCLSVKHKNIVTLLALDFIGAEGAARSPFLLQDAPNNPDAQKIADKYCLTLGKAEFYVADLQSLPTNDSAVGHLALGPTGPVIIGRVDRGSGDVKPGYWLIATGESRDDIGGPALYPSRWEVGVMNSAGNFEKVLGFPFRAD